MTIKHGKIHPFQKPGVSRSHLDPIAKYVTKGVCDARESVVIEPQACDVKGAKRFNGQQCVIAKALTRIHKPEAVAVGRAFAYIVQDGLAIRFKLTKFATKVVEEFDQRGRARNVPIELGPVPKNLHFGKKKQSADTRKTRDPSAPKKKRMKRIGVRSIGGGMSA